MKLDIPPGPPEVADKPAAWGAVFALFLALGYGYFRLTGRARAANLAPVETA